MPRGKVFTKLIRNHRRRQDGRGDMNFNPRLRLAIDKAREETCRPTISTAPSSVAPVSWKAWSTKNAAEGYGIGGAAVMVDCLTDNKTRTVADVRHAFNKYGGNMGTDGCVAFQFKHCGYLVFAPAPTKTRSWKLRWKPVPRMWLRMTTARSKSSPAVRVRAGKKALEKPASRRKWAK